MERLQEVLVPDLGDFDAVDVIEVLVHPGDRVAVGDSLITLESDKASMEVPAPVAGVVKEIKVAVGDKVGENAPICTLAPGDGPTESASSPEPVAARKIPRKEPEDDESPRTAAPETPRPSEPSGPSAPPGRPLEWYERPDAAPHASPSVRQFARELGADLHQVRGSGPKGRILRTDVQAFVKSALRRPASASGSAGVLNLPEPPTVDFSKFGPTEVAPLNRIRKLSATHIHRSWLTIPHVTQFDEADVTAMEKFRKSNEKEAAEKGFKLTPLTFLMKACVAALKEFPHFNSSLSPSGEELTLKHYFHIGVAVDTANGLVVPVIRDVDRKGLFDLAEELANVSRRAREGNLTPADIQGGCFTISSLGGIGGTHFTPIIRAPEVAILGVSRATWRPVHRDGEFVPRLILPIALSYDHRVIDGAEAVRFTTFLSSLLSDVRRLLL